MNAYEQLKRRLNNAERAMQDAHNELTHAAEESPPASEIRGYLAGTRLINECAIDLVQRLIKQNPQPTRGD